MQYALAASSSTGYSIVWDLHGKPEIVTLAYDRQHAGNRWCGPMSNEGMFGMAESKVDVPKFTCIAQPTWLGMGHYW